jgi:hypothetical protein
MKLIFIQTTIRQKLFKDTSTLNMLTQKRMLLFAKKATLFVNNIQMSEVYNERIPTNLTFILFVCFLLNTPAT